MTDSALAAMTKEISKIQQTNKQLTDKVKEMERTHNEQPATKESSRNDKREEQKGQQLDTGKYNKDLVRIWEDSVIGDKDVRDPPKIFEEDERTMERIKRVVRSEEKARACTIMMSKGGKGCPLCLAWLEKEGELPPPHLLNPGIKRASSSVNFCPNSMKKEKLSDLGPVRN